MGDGGRGHVMAAVDKVREVIGRMIRAKHRSRSPLRMMMVVMLTGGDSQIHTVFKCKTVK